MSQRAYTLQDVFQVINTQINQLTTGASSSTGSSVLIRLAPATDNALFSDSASISPVATSSWGQEKWGLFGWT